MYKVGVKALITFDRLLTDQTSYENTIIIPPHVSEAMWEGMDWGVHIVKDMIECHALGGWKGKEVDVWR